MRITGPLDDQHTDGFGGVVWGYSAAGFAAWILLDRLCAILTVPSWALLH